MDEPCDVYEGKKGDRHVFLEIILEYATKATMPRSARSWTSELSGSFHIISRIAGGELILGKQEKEYLLLLLEKYAKGYFVEVHTFCFMGNHFHILATSLDQKAKKASHRELMNRYKAMYGKNIQPPVGSFENDGTVTVDDDEGIERLRERLGSISRFTQELKQGFSRWYNKREKRQGYLWADRFKGVIVGLGEAQLVCSAYIDLNPIRARIVKIPDDYRWSSIGLRARNPKRANQLLKPIKYSPILGKQGNSWYRLFVYEAGSIKKNNKAAISSSILQSVQTQMGKLKLGNKLRYRFKNLSEGQAIGSKELIEQVQKINKCKNIKARQVINEGKLYSTRVLSTKK